MAPAAPDTSRATRVVRVALLRACSRATTHNHPLGGTLEVTQLAAAAAAEQVKAAEAAKDAADAGLAAAEDKEKAAADKAVQNDKWVAYVDPRSCGALNPTN